MIEGFSLWLVIIVAFWALACGVAGGFILARISLNPSSGKGDWRDFRHIGGRGVLGIRAN